MCMVSHVLLCYNNIQSIAIPRFDATTLILDRTRLTLIIVIHKFTLKILVVTQ